MQNKVKGVVLKTMDLKEKDRIMWLFTEELGRISVACKGLKSPKSRYQSLVMPLVYGDFVLFKGKSMFSLNEGAIITSFSGLREDLVLLTYGTYFTELVDIVSVDNEPNPRLFRELVTALYLLESQALDPEMLARAFEIKVIVASGLPVSPENTPYGLAPGAQKVVEFLGKTELSKIGILSVNERDRKEIRNLTEYLLAESYTRRPKSLDMLKFL